MSLLLVGVSHRTAPVALLDQIAAHTESVTSLRNDIAASPFVAEVMVVSTCNRLEVTAEVVRFHGAVTDISSRLAKHTGVHLDELTTHLYVHFEERAVHHMFTVASGLDSMIVGEQQILGQVRGSLRDAQEAGNAGRVLNDLGQTALRIGKRVHSETGIDRHGASVVSVALDLAQDVTGALSDRTALVVGAGAMSSLSLQTLANRGVSDITVASRTTASTKRAADLSGATPIGMDELPGALQKADVIVSATGANGVVITAEDIATAMSGRPDRALVVVDLALPHDTEPEVGAIRSVTRIDLADLAHAPGAAASQSDLDVARTLIDDEVRAFLADQAAQRVEPIVVSLRAHADQVVEAELQRLRLRVPDLDDDAAEEVARSLRRAVSTLLHTPTVRMKQLASDPDGTRYATALHRLFDLDPEAIEALSAAQDAGADPTVAQLLEGPA